MFGLYAETASLSLFIDKLAAKGQSAAQRRQARAAVQGYHEIAARANKARKGQGRRAATAAGAAVASTVSGKNSGVS